MLNSSSGGKKKKSRSVLYILKTDQQPLTVSTYVWTQRSLKTNCCQMSAVILGESESITAVVSS